MNRDDINLLVITAGMFVWCVPPELWLAFGVPLALLIFRIRARHKVSQ